MPEHLRALAVILATALLVFAIVQAPASAVAMSPEDFRRRRNAWLLVTLAAFVSQNFWLFLAASAVVLLWASQRENNRMALFFFLIFAVPAFGAHISGLGIIQTFFQITWLRLLALVVLLPAWLQLRKEPGTAQFGKLAADRFMFAFLFVALALQLTVDTFTNTLRFTFYAFIDVFLPYYVASRSLQSIARLREVMMAFVVAAMLMVPVAVFEFGKSWLLYGSLSETLGVIRSEISSFLLRDDYLRAMASVQHPIVLGYVMAVAIGLFLCLRRRFPSPLIWSAGLAALTAGLVVPLSRGPWLGAVVVIVVFIASGARSLTHLVRLGLVGVIALPAVFMSPLADKIIRFLPFVGEVESETIDYRHRLIEIALNLIAENPWFGAFDYMYSPEIQELKQGQGIIDIVNSYVAIGLSNGLVGLSMFVLFFVFALRGVLLGMRKQKDKEGEFHLLGQSLLACLAGVLVMIFTVSSISVIPIIYWSLGGMCVAYASIAATQAQTEAASRGSLAEKAPRLAVGERLAGRLRIAR